MVGIRQGHRGRRVLRSPDGGGRGRLAGRPVRRPRLVGRQEAVGLGLIVAAGGFLRFYALGRQSYWYDESVTAAIVRGSLGHALSALPRSESTPPLYYVLAWAWSHVAGTSEAGLRSLSALAGTATLPVAWAAIRRLVGWRAGLIAAALLAVNPMLVWYSQEARAYSLLVLLCALSLLFFVRLREAPTRLSAVGWAISCALALLTHYFAVFVIAIEAAWLLAEQRGRRRALVTQLVPIAVVALALVPLAVHQERGGRTAWIAGASLGGRVGDVVHELASANVGLISSASSAPHGGLGPYAVVLVAIGAALAVFAAAPEERRGGLIAAAVGLGALVLPVLAGLASIDFFKDRNLIAAWVPLAGFLAAGLTARRTLPIGIAVAAGVCALGVAVDIQVTRDRDLQRQDWRGLARDLGPVRKTRAVVVVPGYATTPLQIYGQELGPALEGLRVRELVVLGQLPARRPVPEVLDGASLVEDRSYPGLRLVRYRSSRGYLALTRGLLEHSPAPVRLQAGPGLIRWLTAYVHQTERWRAALRALRASPRAPVPVGLLAPSAAAVALLPLPPELAGEARLREAVVAGLALARRMAGEPTEAAAAEAAALGRAVDAMLAALR